jgi:hypothetical protein
MSGAGMADIDVHVVVSIRTRGSRELGCLPTLTLHKVV